MDKDLQDIIKILSADLRILPASGGLLFAVSGGPDSTTLVDIIANNFPSIKKRMRIAYIHHGLRKNADRELLFVKNIAKKWDIPFHSRKIKINKTSDKSLEEIARIKRYDALFTIAKKYNCCAVVTAHTSDDNAETIIFNLLNGSGLKGLCGIFPSTQVKDGLFLLRPMLSVSKSQIISYINKRNLRYLTDESNLDTRFKRNFIRHKIFPLFEKINPAFKKNISRTSKILTDDYLYIKSTAEEILEKYFTFDKDSVIFSSKIFKKFHPSIQRFVLRKIIVSICGLSHPIDFATIERIRNTVISGNKIYIEKYNILVMYDNGNITIQKHKLQKSKPLVFSVSLKIPGKTKIPDFDWTIITRYTSFKKNFLKNPDRFVAYINAQAVKNNLIVCNPDMHTHFIPLGMDKQVSFHKYWKTHKKHITKFVQFPVVVQDGKKIVWVIGGQISDDYAIKKVNRILEIRIIKES